MFVWVVGWLCKDENCCFSDAVGSYIVEAELGFEWFVVGGGCCCSGTELWLLQVVQAVCWPHPAVFSCS